MSRILLLGLIALAILCVLCLTCHAPRIESDIQGRALGKLSGLGLDPSLLEISGCAVTLRGDISSDDLRSEALALIKSLPGVCSVTDRLVVHKGASSGTAPAAAASTESMPEPLAAEAGSLAMRIVDGRIVLAGEVPTEAVRQSLLAEARARWGEGNVVDQLKVVEGATTEGWPQSFADMMDALHATGEDLDISLSDGKVTVTGSVLSELARERVLGAVSTALPGYEVIDRLTLREAATAAEVVQASLDSQLQGKVVEFENNSDQLTARGRAVLDQLEDALSGNDAAIEISGHTDSRGDAAHNLDLSQRRAESAKRYLVGKGLATERFTTLGYGETRPIANNETAEGRQRNRRTEFRVQEEK